MGDFQWKLTCLSMGCMDQDSTIFSWATIVREFGIGILSIRLRARARALRTHARETTKNSGCRYRRWRDSTKMQSGGVGSDA